MTAATRTIKPLLAAAAVALCGALAVAPSASASEPACPNEQVRSQSNIDPATGKPYDLGLPECRAYEMVSPLEKQAHSAQLAAEGKHDFNSVAAANGESVAFSSLGGFAGIERFSATSEGNPYVARRGTSGWVTEGMPPPAALLPGAFFDAYGPGLSVAATCGTTGADDYLASQAVSCAIREPDGSWLTSPAYPNLAGADVSISDFGGHGYSRNLADAVFQLNNKGGHHLLPNDTGQKNPGSIYEVVGLGGASPELRLVSVDSAGNVIGPEHETHLGGRLTRSSLFHAVSEDGQRIFFTATPAGSGVENVYARRYLPGGAAETVDISSPSPSQCARTASEPGGECSAPASGVFEGASGSGEKAFFLTKQQLVNADTDSITDLYEYDFAEPAGSRVVQVSGGGIGDPTPGSGASVQGVVRVSNDGSHVYFVATGVLSTVPNAAGQTALAGADNLYGFDTETRQTKFVAQLCSGHEVSGSQRDAACPSPGGDTSLWAISDVATRRAQTTPNGRYLIFDTDAQLSPEDQAKAQRVYRYDFQTGELILVSHAAPEDPTAGNGELNAVISAPGYVAGGAAGDVENESRQISANGSAIVFSTAEPLQADVNAGENPGCEGATQTGCNVYEWHEGVVHMISDGQSPSNTHYEAPTMSASGADIFFTTYTKLVGQDTDKLADVYDARIDGGFPAPAPEPSCSGEECQGTPSTLPVFEAPGTVAFTGGKNVTPAPPSKESREAPPVLQIRVLHHRVHRFHAIVVVHVPSAGKLIANGRGVSKVKARVGKAGNVRIVLKLKHHFRKLLRHHRRRKIEVLLHLRFKPRHGHTAKRTVHLRFKYSIRVRRRHSHGAKATIIVDVPSAGKLIAGGKGVARATKPIAKHGGRMAVTVHLKRHFRRKLRHSHRHHITVKLHLKFKPAHGETLRAQRKVKLR